MSLGEEINQITAGFPRKENFSLSSQIRRSADSIALNISEGSILQSNMEFRRFLGYSIRSLTELLACIR
ncbi:MAG: four helix bundle protein [Sediminicola sp.]|jgi:four helix bundle protein